MVLVPNLALFFSVLKKFEKLLARRSNFRKHLSSVLQAFMFGFLQGQSVFSRSQHVHVPAFWSRKCECDMTNKVMSVVLELRLNSRASTLPEKIPIFYILAFH